MFQREYECEIGFKVGDVVNGGEPNHNYKITSISLGDYYLEIVNHPVEGVNGTKAVASYTTLHRYYKLVKQPTIECICGAHKLGYNKPGRAHSAFMKCPMYKE
jgi:hypothetical protein